MRVALDAAPLTLSSGGLARYVRELHRALEAAFPEDEFPLLASRPRRADSRSAAGGCAASPGNWRAAG